jgi:TolB-like protein/cytochrome c-type biogenesis protein CcmH/NrfG
MRFRNFLTELRRRNVYKVAVAYAVVAWLLIQAGSILFPTFGAPAWVMKVFVTIVGGGFPIALIIAWAFEMTPEGVKRTENVPPGEFIPQWSRRKFAVLVISIALAAGGLLGFQIWRSTKVEAASDKSIAVLPFDNLSDEKENAYFAEGIQDEILTRLAKIADLKVISRTSTQKYKSAPDNLREIADKLGVANILEGSVQKSGETVRVTVQLIQATNDSHLWAETYDRQLSDIFGVETEVAQKIAGSLEAKLTGGEKQQIASAGTRNAQAYESLLHALALRNTCSGADTDTAIEYCRRATEQDPGYSEAWATLAIIQAGKFSSPWQSGELEKSTRAAAETALRLAPDSPRAHQAMGLYYRYCRNENRAGAKELEKAQELAPNDGSILSNLGAAQRACGQVEQSLETMKKAANLDPLNVDAWYALASTYHGLRRFEEARSIYDRALAISPTDMDLLGEKARTYQAEGNLGAAWTVLRAYPFPPFSEYAVVAYHDQYYLWRDYGPLIQFIEADDLARKTAPPIIAAGGDVLLANLYLLNGEPDLARPRAQRAEREMQELREQKLGVTDVSGAYIECMARIGNRDEAEREIEHLSAETGDNQWLMPACEASAAAGYGLLGDIDKAVPLLKDSLSKPNGTTTAYLRLNPAWDGLRNNPRFQKLISTVAESRP